MMTAFVIAAFLMYQSCLSTVSCSSTIPPPPPPAYTGGEQLTDTEAYESGRKLVLKYEREATMPKYSQCWTKALAELQSGCSRLTDDRQHRMALMFANCFRMKSGRSQHNCDEGQEFVDCARHMDSEAYDTYLNFFISTHSMCYFLQIQNWQAETQNTIGDLTQSSNDVVKQLHTSADLQNKLIEHQRTSIENQESLLTSGLELRGQLDASANDVHKMLEEFANSTYEQKMLIIQVFERISSLQSLVMNEFTGFYSLIFYTVSILISYLLTSTTMTSDSRFYLFLIMTFNIIVERTILWFCDIGDATEVNATSNNERTYVYLWISRKMAIFASATVWLWCAFRYRDYVRHNNEMLKDIREQNTEIKKYLISSTPVTSKQTLKTPPSLGSLKPHDCGNDEVLSIKKMVAQRLNAVSNGDQSSNLGYCSGDSDSDCYSDDDSDTSTDRTYCAEDSDDSDTTCTRSTRSRSITPSLHEELRFLKESTPMRELCDVAVSLGESIGLITPSKIGTHKSPYNLRSRLKVKVNPSLQFETEQDFANEIRSLAKKTKRNNRLAISKKLFESRNGFSTDDHP